MADLHRIHRRLPFGIQNPTRLMIGALVIGGAAAGIGYGAHITGLAVTGLCVLMTVPFFAMAFAWARNTPRSLAVRDDGFEVDLGSRVDVIPWSEISGLTVHSSQGAGMNLFLERPSGRYAVGLGSYPRGAIDELVAHARQRIAGG